MVSCSCPHNGSTISQQHGDVPALSSPIPSQVSSQAAVHPYPSNHPAPQLHHSPQGKLEAFLHAFFTRFRTHATSVCHRMPCPRVTRHLAVRRHTQLHEMA